MSAVYRLALCDRQNAELADVTSYSFEKKGSYRLNRPATWTFRVPLDQAGVTAVHTDGDPNLAVLNRQLKVYRTPSGGGAAVKVFNGLVWNVERDGDENGAGSASVTCVDPMIWWNHRLVKDAFTGAIVDPKFATPIAGATIIKESLYSSILYDTTLSLNVTDGTLDQAIPPAYDLAAVFSDWPLTIGDLVKRITDTGACDVWVEPVDATDGATGADGAGYGLEETGFGGDGKLAVMGRLHAVNMRGGEVAAHFDYATGDYSIKQIKHTQGAETIANFLRYYLGPRLDRLHWRGSIDADAPLPDPPQTELRTMRDDSRKKYGVWTQVSIYDDEGFENDLRAMYGRLWQLEFRLRALPKELVKFTPVAEAPYLPFEHYDLGDIVGVNAGGMVLGFNLSGAAQRVYGFDVDVDENGVERVGEIVASASEIS